MGTGCSPGLGTPTVKQEIETRKLTNTAAEAIETLAQKQCGRRDPALPKVSSDLHKHIVALPHRQVGRRTALKKKENVASKSTVECLRTQPECV